MQQKVKVVKKVKVLKVIKRQNKQVAGRKGTWESDNVASVSVCLSVCVGGGAFACVSGILVGGAGGEGGIGKSTDGAVVIAVVVTSHSPAPLCLPLSAYPEIR